MQFTPINSFTIKLSKKIFKMKVYIETQVLKVDIVEQNSATVCLLSYPDCNQINNSKNYSKKLYFCRFWCSN